MTSPIGIIGGSGLYQMDGVKIEEEKQIQTPFGEPSDVIRLGQCEGVPVAFLPRHGSGHRVIPSEINFRANIWALKSLGVDSVIAVSAVGSMKEEIVPGHLVLIDQFVDRTRNRVSTFFGDGCVAHVSFADPICLDMQAALAKASTALDTKVHVGGTYICIEGPMFSTRAESKLFKSWGVDVIGMTNYQEARLAREAELPYATIALATDYDAWREGDAVHGADVLEVMKANVQNAQKLIRQALPSVHGASKTSIARSALKGAIYTDPARITPQARERLSLLIAPYI